MNFPVYEGVHEAIIAEEDWELAQEKRSKNNYRREKIHDPEHAHILSGILKCPCCGKGMYGNIAKAGRKDNKTRYYYYCKNTVNAQMKLKPLWFGLFLMLLRTGCETEIQLIFLLFGKNFIIQILTVCNSRRLEVRQD